MRPVRRIPWGLVRTVLGRLIWAGVVVYVVVSGIFALFVLAPDYGHINALWAQAMEGEAVEVEEPPPLHEQYIEWINSVLTLQWGESETAAQRDVGLVGGESNVAAVVDAATVTLTYVIPATGLAFLLGIGIGYYAARRSGSWLDRLLSGSTYLAFSVPNFFLAAVIFYTLLDWNPGWFPNTYDAGAGLTVENLLWLVLPGFVLVTHLVAGQFRYSRNEANEALGERYVTLLRAKGVGRIRIARHVFRNAALPLVTLFVTELVGVLLVTVFVIEIVFQVPGVGMLAYDAVVDQDLELVMVLTAVFATTVVLANLVQDLVILALDPRAGH